MTQENVNCVRSKARHFARSAFVAGLAAALAIGTVIPANALTPAPATFADFQIGWWSSVGLGDMTRLQTEANAGQNYQVAYAYDAGTLTYETALAATGARSMLNIPNDYVKMTNSSAIAGYVNKYKGNATITAWHLVDEPEDHGIAPITVRTAYSAAKSADPSRPVAVNYYHNNCTYVGQTMGFGDLIGDIVMFERYPVFNGLPYENMADWRQMIDDCQTYLTKNARASFIGFIPVVQAFSWADYGIAGRDPTYGELRYMAFRGAIKRLTIGTQFWADYHASATLKGSVNRVMSELASYTPLFRAGTEADTAIKVSSLDAAVSATNIKYKRWQNMIAAVNDLAGSVHARILLPTGMSASSVKLLKDRYSNNSLTYESRTLPVTKDASGRYYFDDWFVTYESHIYCVVTPTTPC